MAEIKITGSTSDGYHTFDELYEHRIVLYLALCRQLVYQGVKQLRPWRSLLHSDDTKYESWFILGIGKEPGEQITYHLPMHYWGDTFFAETLDRAPEFDGHTSADVLERIGRL